MVRHIYHFIAEKPFENLSLGANHKLPGYVAQYLKQFQFDGIRFLYRNFEINQSCILNDDNGLGKTLQITAFLTAVFSQDSSKKCLIIVKDEKRIVNWKFHLGVFTKFCVKVIFKQEDALDENIYLTKWNSLLKSASLHRLDFDYVIVDDRDGLLSNRSCLSYLLKHYTNRVSLIVSSNDVVMELKLFHNMLKLCGLLSKEHENLKHFEEKFSLPPHVGSCDKDVLEAYFIRREKIINFCRDFRLRRYRHQYEDLLPLVAPLEYEKSLKLWHENAKRASSLSTSSDSVKIISSSDCDTEELFESFFATKDERKLSKDVSKMTSDKSIARRESDCEDVVMSPLLFESDSEDDVLKKQVEQNNVCNVRSENEENEKNSANSSAVPKSPSRRKSKNKRSSTPPNNGFIRQTRSLNGKARITRSTAHRNKFLVSDISDNVKRIDRIEKKRRCSKRKGNTGGNKDEKGIEGTVEKKQSENLKKFQKSSSEESKYDFKIDLINKAALQDAQSATDVQFITSSADDLIVLSSSSIEQESRNENDDVEGNISPSQDLFATATAMNDHVDDYNITCTQHGSAFKQNKPQAPSKSCVVMLGKCFQNDETKPKRNSTSEIKDEIIFEISTTKGEQNENSASNASAANTLTQIKNKMDGNGRQSNKITKYLIGTVESSLSSSDENLTTSAAAIRASEVGKMQYHRNSEASHRTPKRQKIQKRSVMTSGKKSPKINSNNPTPTGLTKWLIKPSSGVKSPKKNLKRRRLDISFQNL